MLDEADRLTEKGHFAALNAILIAISAPAPSKDEFVAATDEAADAVPPPASDFSLVATPSRYKRQTFLFSATLGIATAQTARDASSALVAAQAAAHSSAATATNAAAGGGGTTLSTKMGKKALRRAVAEAALLTPMEALMARVGLTGTPFVLTAGEEEGAPPPPDGVAAPIALPAGLRLCRLTCATPTAKLESLYHFLLRFPGRTLVFVNSIGGVRRLAAALGALGLPVTSLHASLLQRQRLAHLEKFRSSENGVLVATDVAARGLDVPGVAYVVHYGLPHSAEAFVHRCGRTARGLTDGLAAALVGPEDARQYDRIMGVLGLVVGLPELPLDSRFGRGVAERARLAEAIAAAQTSLDRAAANSAEVLRLSASTEIDVDVETAREMGVSGAAMVGQGEGGGRPRAAQLDEDAVAEVQHGARAAADELRSMRRSLAALLRVPLTPGGMSRRYVAVAGHVALAGMGGGESAAPPIMRDGALVAGKVAPSASAVPVGVRPGAMPAGTGAIAALARGAKHLWVPGVSGVAGRKRGGARG